VGGGLHDGGDKFGERNAGQDEQGSGGAAAAETLAEDEERGDPGKNGLEGEDESGMGGGQVALGPGLHGEGYGGGEDGGDQQGKDKARRRVNPGMLEERHADGHEGGAEADLEEGELFKGKARREVGEGEDVQGESEGAAEGEQVAEIDGAEREAGGGGEEDDPEEGEERSAPGIPGRRRGSDFQS